MKRELQDFDTSPELHDDRRTDDRHITLFRVGVLHTRKAKEFCRITNVSAGGLKARIYSETGLGERVQVEMKSGQLMQGSVVWVTGHHVGIKFVENVDVRALLSAQTNTEAGSRPRLPRMEIDRPIRMRLGGRYYPATLCDISQGGAKVRTAGPAPEAGPVALMLPEFPTLHGAVRWSRGDRAGISFNQWVSLEALVELVQDCRRPAPLLLQQA